MPAKHRGQGDIVSLVKKNVSNLHPDFVELATESKHSLQTLVLTRLAISGTRIYVIRPLRRHHFCGCLIQLHRAPN